MIYPFMHSLLIAGIGHVVTTFEMGLKSTTCLLIAGIIHVIITLCCLCPVDTHLLIAGILK